MKYKLPDGSQTTDIAVFAKTMIDWINHIQAHMPGWKVTTYDPGFTLVKGKTTVQLPVEIVVDAWGVPGGTDEVRHTDN